MKRRTSLPGEITPSELAWLTGRDVPGMNVFWVHSRGAEKAERCRWLLVEFAHLVPPTRFGQIEEDLRHWDR